MALLFFVAAVHQKMHKTNIISLYGCGHMTSSKAWLAQKSQYKPAGLPQATREGTFQNCGVDGEHEPGMKAKLLALVCPANVVPMGSWCMYLQRFKPLRKHTPLLCLPVCMLMFLG